MSSITHFDDSSRHESVADCTLVHEARRGDSHAFDALFRRYRPNIFGIARRFFAPGADRDDLLQEAMIGFFKAVRDYKPESGSFSAFATLCVQRQVITFIKTATRRKHRALNQAISFDAPVFADSSDSLLSRLAAPEDSCDADPTHSVFLEGLWKACSELEQGVLSLYTRGYSFAEMASELGVHLKAIDNAVWRVKVKAKRLLSKQPLEI